MDKKIRDIKSLGIVGDYIRIYEQLENNYTGEVDNWFVETLGKRERDNPIKEILSLCKKMLG